MAVITTEGLIGYVIPSHIQRNVLLLTTAALVSASVQRSWSRVCGCGGICPG